ncbi:unnamed protein product [Oppiella nova]|uniref:Nuclear receptor domain-containing protein n=1 Tax=Oppiella nova TaxID=334625 RepID=A0A7R9LC84_9ACAR|nr:unnamed protein product [Oppiella nova]CAG2162072.1 unnamed protein product [Oppiella nova]
MPPKHYHSHTQPRVLVPNCEICGDKGVGRNFGAISCESCKTFFRRNSLKLKEFKCKYDDECIIGKYTRNICKKCRLVKCFSVGMKKKIHENINISEDSSSSDTITDVLDTDIDTGIVSDIYENNKTVFRNVVALNQSIKIHLNHTDSRNTSIAHELTQYLSTPVLRPINTYKELNEIECKHLLDLCLASKVFHFPSTTLKYTHVTNIIEFYLSWGNRIEMDSQCVVSIAKELTKNADISLNDQIALVKYSSMEISVLRANYNYDLQTENWTLYLNNDNSVIILFNPDRPNIINKDVIKYQQKMYIYLLQRYLSMKYRWEWLWRYKMSNLMNALIDVNIVGRIEILNGVEDYIEYFGPVSQEMFRDIYKD